VPLLAVLAWPDTIRRVDPAAVPAASKGPAYQPVWYVRVIDQPAAAPGTVGGGDTVRWLLLDEIRLRVIATGLPDAEVDVAAHQANGPSVTTALVR